MKAKLGIFFILAVIIPSTILGVIAVRAIRHEKVYLEKSLEDTLLAELNQTVILLNAQLDNLQQELKNSLDFPKGSDDYPGIFASWKQSSSLVKVPFLISSTNQVLWPLVGKGSSNEETSFLADNKDFLASKLEIPVLMNVAADYYKETESAWSSGGPQQKASQSLGQYVRQQRAVAKYQKSPEVRKRVYEEAQREEKQLLARNINIPTSHSGKQEDDQIAAQSIFIAQPSKLREIIKQGEYGIIPRFIEEKLQLLFWVKDEADGSIVGCSLNLDEFKENVLGVLPETYSSTRILTILDENGHPLVTPKQGGGRDWRSPFVSCEISEILPRWEIAAYLTDPDSISARAQLMSVVMWTLVLILLVSIVSGGTLIIRASTQQLVLAQQKTTFVANVSHELKTPLTSIRMFAEMLKQKRQHKAEKREEYLGIMVSETERLAQLINNVLDFSKIEEGKKSYYFQELDIVSLAENILGSQRIRLQQKGFKADFATDIDQLQVKADEEAIRQVILNLLSNAEKYSEESKEIVLEVTRSQNNALINIKDRGIGILPAQAKKIFDKFYRVDDRLTSRVKGTGLGLTIALKIAQDHGGNISYLPREGGGSIFQVSLPIKN